MTTYSYDDNGNLITKTEPVSPDQWTYTYQYNQRNLLIAASSSQTNYSGPRTQYTYDGAGNRIRQTNYEGGPVPPMEPSAITTYTNDALGLTQVLVANDGTEQVYNLYGLDLIAQDDGVETRVLLADGLGSARTEMVGPAVETVTTYSPYGKLLAQTGDSGTTYGFTGEQHDGATGLVYLRARYYSPYIHQFQSKDPFPGYSRQPQSHNGYNYVHSNPVNNIDPRGLCIEDPYDPYFDYDCWALAERAWLQGLGPLEYLGTLSEAELRLILGGTRFYCTDNYGCFDTGHINPGKVDEVLSDIERYLTTGELIDLRGGFGPRSGFVAYYSVSQGLPSEKKQGVALGILMDYEIRWERLQGTIPFGPGAASSFALEDLPSDYLGYIIGFNYCPEERNDAVFELFELLGGASPVENLPHPTTQVIWSEANRIPSETSTMSTIVIEVPITNHEFTPIVPIEGEWQNVPWPDELRLTPIDSSSSLWQHVRSGFCLLGVPWIHGDCG